MRSSKPKLRINQEITISEVRLVDDKGGQVGVVTIEEALAAAKNKGLDLVEIAPDSAPPVCKLLDYGKYYFEQHKKKGAAKKKQKKIQVKEIKLRPVTEEGDYQVKLRNLIRFLKGGDKTKVTIRFRGREMAHRELGLKVLERIREDLLEYGVVEAEPKLEGRQLMMVLAPKK